VHFLPLPHFRFAAFPFGQLELHSGPLNWALLKSAAARLDCYCCLSGRRVGRALCAGLVWELAELASLLASCWELASPVEALLQLRNDTQLPASFEGRGGRLLAGVCLHPVQPKLQEPALSSR